MKELKVLLDYIFIRSLSLKTALTLILRLWNDLINMRTTDLANHGTESKTPSLHQSAGGVSCHPGIQMTR